MSKSGVDFNGKNTKAMDPALNDLLKHAKENEEKIVRI